MQALIDKGTMRQWVQGGVVMCAYASVTAEKETGVESSGLLSKVCFFSDARAFCLEEVYTSLYHARLYIYIYMLSK